MSASEWAKMLDCARTRVAAGDSIGAFRDAYGALEVCFSAEAGVSITGDGSFTDTIALLKDRKRLRPEDADLAHHLRKCRNSVLHRFGFEPSVAEAARTIYRAQHLCSRFARKVYEIMTKPVRCALPDDPIGRFTRQMRDDGISQFPVVDADGQVIGTLDDDAVLSALLREEGIVDLEQSVRAFMKPDILPEIAAAAPVDDARRRLAAPGAPALLVLADRRPTGIVTKYDLIV